jgi:electron transport complex protein RnfB
VLPLNPDNGLEGPRSVVWIDEAWCIGCTLCIEACPVDAIIGTHKRMHTVIEQACTGCELCLPVCPVDCIELENVSGTATGWDAWSAAQAEEARQRYAARQERLQEAAPMAPVEALPQQKISRVEAALMRAKQRAEQNKND